MAKKIRIGLMGALHLPNAEYLEYLYHLGYEPITIIPPMLRFSAYRRLDEDALIQQLLDLDVQALYWPGGADNTVVDGHIPGPNNQKANPNWELLNRIMDIILGEERLSHIKHILVCRSYQYFGSKHAGLPLMQDLAPTNTIRRIYMKFKEENIRERSDAFPRYTHVPQPSIIKSARTGFTCRESCRHHQGFLMSPSLVGRSNNEQDPFNIIALRGNEVRNNNTASLERYDIYGNDVGKSLGGNRMIMGYTYGQNILAFQYHPETTMSAVAGWLIHLLIANFDLNEIIVPLD